MRPIASYASYPSPIGTILVASGEGGLTRLAVGEAEEDFVSSFSLAGHGLDRDDARFAGLFRELDEYFLGRPVSFGVRLSPEGSAFDRAVWRALASIPWGEKRSYAEVASLAGSPGAARAVGGACGRNPIPVIIPCHRVLRSDGTIGGYSGGEGVKEKLLALEGIRFRSQPGQ